MTIENEFQHCIDNSLSILREMKECLNMDNDTPIDNDQRIDDLFMNIRNLSQPNFRDYL